MKRALFELSRPWNWYKKILWRCH